MKKNEFLRELETSLKGKLSQRDLDEVLSDYSDLFEDGLLENKTEDEISQSIGSPAAISKAIIDDSVSHTPLQSGPAPAKDFSDLAPMSKRFLAYMIDTAVLVFLFTVIFMIGGSVTGSFSSGSMTTEIDGPVVGPHYREKTILDRNNNVKKIKFYKDGKKVFSGNTAKYNQYMEDHNISYGSIRSFEKHRPLSSNLGLKLPLMMFLPYLLIFMGLGLGNIFTAFELWLFNGYTLGKWLTKIKVVRLDDRKLTFWDGFLREIVLKFFSSAITSGILNMVSFIIGCARPDHKTIHDLAAKTKVINIQR